MRVISILAIFLFIFSSSFSQSIKDLEKERNKTQKELEYSNTLLNKTQKDRIQTVNQLNILNNRVKLQNKYLEQTQSQILLLEKEVLEKTNAISQLNFELERLKEDYANLIRYAWKSRSDRQVLVFIFSSTSFNQAYRRFRFSKQFIRFREQQALEIEETKRIIDKEVQDLEVVKLELEKNKQIRTKSLTELRVEEKQVSKNVQTLRNKEKQLLKEIEARKKSMALLNKTINDLIAEEARKAGATKVRDGRYLQISAGFEGNKGKLPWPTDSGLITSAFGEHNHPVLKGVKIKNDGIDITTNKGSAVRAIFEGEVTKVVSIPGSNIAILIRHGDYLTVYSNISKVTVKSGDRVKALQPIGQATTEPSTDKGIYNLQIWRESTILNPSQWLLP